MLNRVANMSLYLESYHIKSLSYKLFRVTQYKSFNPYTLENH